jgi:hypothetical protein
MEGASARQQWRDGLIVAALAIVIVGGLIHYGRALGEREPGAARSGHSSATRSPTAEATAQLEGAPSTDPASPPSPSGGTCWDGRETASLRLCGLPDGARGLAWVFPSFERDRAQCHPAAPDTDSYPVVESYECFQHALGRPVTVTYDQVGDPRQVERLLSARFGPGRRHKIAGAHGGRYVFTDADRPARITGLYARFPYVVSVYAETPRAAARAWKTIVEQRAPQHVLGTST